MDEEGENEIRRKRIIIDRLKVHNNQLKTDIDEMESHSESMFNRAKKAEEKLIDAVNVNRTQAIELENLKLWMDNGGDCKFGSCPTCPKCQSPLDGLIDDSCHMRCAKCNIIYNVNIITRIQEESHVGY